MDLETKKTIPLTFTTPVLNLISDQLISFDENTKQVIREHLASLDSLRADVISCGGSGTASNTLISFGSKVTDYVTCLEILRSKIPISGEDESLKLGFTWYNAVLLDPRDSRKPVTSHDVRFEQASILYNYAICALSSALSSYALSDYRQAASLFALSAGIFDFVISLGLQLPASCDLQPLHLDFLKQFALARAQECFVHKAVKEGKTKDSLLARLADGAADLFESVRRLSSALPAISESMNRFLDAKSHYYKAVSAHRRSLESQTQSKYGEEIAYLRVAQGHLNSASSLLASGQGHTSQAPTSSLPGDIQSLFKIVNETHEKAVHDNNIVYHEPIPKVLSSPPPNAVIAQSTEFSIAKSYNKDANDSKLVLAPSFLANLPEWTEQQALKRDWTEVADLCNRTLITLKNFEERRRLVLSELGLSDFAQKTHMVKEGSEGSLNASLIRKAEEVLLNGSHHGLKNIQSNIENSRRECQSLLRQASDALKREQEQDERFRKLDSTGKWNRSLSSDLNGKMKQQILDIQVILDQAGNADIQVQKDLKENSSMIEQLVSGVASINSITFSNDNSTNPNHIKMKQLMDRLSELESEETSLLHELQAGVTKDRVHQISQRVIDVIGPSWQDLFNQIRSTHSLITMNQQNVSNNVSTTERIVADMESGYQAFKRISGHLDEGFSFYSNLKNRIQALLDEISDFCTSRGIEAEDLRKQLLEIPSSNQGFINQPMPFPGNPPISGFQSNPQPYSTFPVSTDASYHYQQVNPQNSNPNPYSSNPPWSPGMPISYAPSAPLPASHLMQQNPPHAGFQQQYPNQSSQPYQYNPNQENQRNYSQQHNVYHQGSFYYGQQQ